MFYRSVLQFFYPSYCVSCLQLINAETILCITCTGSLKPVVSVFLPLTKKYSLKVVAAYAYQGAAKTLLIKKFSENNLASRQLARLMLAAEASEQFKTEAAYLVPIPLHWTRYAARGFNQSTEMAASLSEQLQIPVLKLLKRKKRTVFQSRLTKEQREQNLADVFGMSPWYAWKDLSFLEQKNIILIDDLCTTGATLQSAARALLPFKPRSITAFVACRAL